VLLNTVETNFYLDIENMFDRKYQVKTGYPCPGFLIKGGLLIKI
jgi:outer membrane cobalamin receptor